MAATALIAVGILSIPLVALGIWLLVRHRRGLAAPGDAAATPGTP